MTTSSYRGETSRLTTLQAAYVVARRDFLAILFSRAFLFFLLGPLFPVIVGAMAGGIGSRVQAEATTIEIGVMMAAADTERMLTATRALEGEMGGFVPPLVAVENPGGGAEALLREGGGNLAAIVSGTPAAPVLNGPEGQVARWSGPVGLIAATAQGTSPAAFPKVESRTVDASGADVKRDRVRTAQGGQMLLFLLTMLLGGMVLSNLVEEKGNKIIEVLAAAIPMDAVFLGKLFAMLGVSFVGIAVWGGAGALLVYGTGLDMGNFAAPAVGWPLFFLLGILYFAMGYLILGSLFLAIGSMAATVREVQTLSMPVTMLQLLVFFFASFAMASPGSPMELAATVFPFSSPFAMLARAAQVDTLWPHLFALAWQGLCVAVFVKLGAGLFRRKVMQSGPKGAKRRKWFRRQKTI